MQINPKALTKMIRMPNVRRLGQHAMLMLTRNAPSILTTFAAGGVVGTAILTHKATLKATEYVNSCTDEATNPETLAAIKRRSYKYYIPPALTGAATIGCVVGANYLNFKKITALAAACSVAETALSDQQAKIQEIFGSKGLEEVENAVAQQRGDYILDSNREIVETGKGTFLCCEGYLTGCKFHASEEWVRRCINEFNELVNQSHYASFNDLLSILGLPEVDFGNELGWNVHINGILVPIFTYDGDPMTGEPYMIFTPRNKPILNYAEIF